MENTKNKPAHTQDKWKLNRYSKTLIGNDDKVIATTKIHCHDGKIHPRGTNDEQAEANALRIVKCVNEHDELVDALKVIEEQIQRTGTITISATSFIRTTIKNILERAQK